MKKCSLSPFAVEEAFTIEKGYLEGIAYDGSNFWISAEYSNESPEYRLQKIALE
ncbi:MAG: hypothetical protein R6T99_00960 [Bacteroidales bacterium]